MAEIKLKIVVEGKDAIPAAMKEAQAAVEQSGVKIDSVFVESRQNARKFGDTTRQEFNKARDSVDLLSGSIGIGIPRELKKVIAGMPALQGALSSAFNVVAVVGLIEVIAQIPEAIDRAAAAISGWDDKAKAAYQHSLDLNKQIVDANEEHIAKVRELNTVGLEGSSKAVQEQKNLQAELKHTQAEFDAAGAAAKAARDANAKLGAKPSFIDVLTPTKLVADHILGTASKLEENQRTITQEEDKGNALLIKRQQITDAQLALEKQLGALRDKERAALEGARNDAGARINTARFSAEEAQLKSKLALGDYTAKQEEEMHVDLENRKYAATQATLNKRLELAKEMFSRDENGSKIAQAKADADLKAAAQEHDAALSSIRLQSATRQRAIDEQAAQQSIDLTRSTGEQQVAIEERWIQRQMAAHRLSIEDTANLETVAAGERYAAQRTALQAELAEAEKHGNQNKNQIDKLNHELTDLEAQHAAEVQGILEKAAAARVALNNRMFEMQMEGAQKAADFELAQEQRRLGQKVLTPGARESAQLEALNRWYSEQRRILEQARENARQVFGETSAEYQKTLEDMTALDRERLQKAQEIQDQTLEIYLKGADRMTDTFLGQMRGWALGQQSLKKAFQNTWNEIVLDLATSLAKQKLMHIAHWAIVNLLHIGAKSQQVGTEAGAAAISHAITASANVAKVISSAGVAAAAGYASAMMTLPYPVNVAVAPAVAAEAFGATVAFAPVAAFARGGIVPSDDLALLHKKEMVLPANISEGLQAAFSKGGSGAGGNTVHVTNHFGNGVSKKDAHHISGQVAKAVRAAIRNGQSGYRDI